MNSRPAYTESAGVTGPIAANALFQNGLMIEGLSLVNT
jgi:hypothetical protein